MVNCIFKNEAVSSVWDIYQVLLTNKDCLECIVFVFKLKYFFAQNCGVFSRFPLSWLKMAVRQMTSCLVLAVVVLIGCYEINGES